MQILLGCGRSRARRVRPEGDDRDFTELVTLDMHPGVGADVVHNLERMPYPFADDSADEIHAYDVLEHLGAQGDWLGLLRQFAELWRILKPGGLICATVPRADSPWAWGDPGHTRVISLETLGFLSQAIYADELDGPNPTNRSDYRPWYRADFDLVGAQALDVQLAFILRAVKPSRWKAPA